MIRPTTPDDVPALIASIVAADLFPADDTSVLDKMFGDYFGGLSTGHLCLTDDEGGSPRGVAYCSPVTATEGTWELLLIFVRPDRQGQGHGAVLLRQVEEALRAKSQRLLLAQTSGLPSFAQARAFYAKCGYEEEARIRDYYAAGDDMIAFCKAL